MAGRRLGPYELEEQLGRGGMGEVWRAVDTRKSRTVALKLLPSELTGDADIEERFRREARVAARLNDPHVIPIHDYGELHGRLYLDMRLVQGVDLAKTLKADGALPPTRAVSIVGQVADALDAAHDDGLVHRDVKPSNILLSGPRRDAGDFVYLIDFGIAAGSMLGTRLTATGHAVGTAAYMAPERFTDDRDVDRRVDVYALGCVLFEMLTGSTPFEGASFPNLMYQHLNAPPPRPSASGELPSGFDDVVATALSKDPDRRYRRAGDLAEAARAVLAAPPPPRPAPKASDAVTSPPRPLGPPVPPMPSTRQAPPDQGRPLPLPPPWRPGGAPPAGPPERGVRRRTGAAVAALVVNTLWTIFTVGETAVTFSDCGTSSLACGGGVIGIVAIGAGVVGIGAAVGGLRGRFASRGMAVAWNGLAVAFVLFLVTAGLDGAATL